MVHEAERAGLKFDHSKMIELQCCPDKIDEYGDRDLEHEKRFHERYKKSQIEATIHDCLRFGGGLSWKSTLVWNILEHLPFRRMDLQKDGTWKAINWPLPLGEPRDIPDEAKIHCSVINRLKLDARYRPGNLVIGGGGRQMRVAPEEYGIGEWEVYEHANDPIKETYIRKKESVQ